MPWKRCNQAGNEQSRTLGMYDWQFMYVIHILAFLNLVLMLRQGASIVHFCLSVCVRKKLGSCFDPGCVQTITKPHQRDVISSPVCTKQLMAFSWFEQAVNCLNFEINHTQPEHLEAG